MMRCQILCRNSAVKELNYFIISAMLSVHKTAFKTAHNSLSVPIGGQVKCLTFYFAVPEDFDYNPATGRHGDRSHRIELKKSSVEYLAPSEYMVGDQ